MRTNDTVRWQSTDMFDTAQSPTWERLTRWADKEAFAQIVLVAVTIGLATFLSSTFYHALQNYRVF